MKLLNRKTLLASAVALALPASFVNAKTFDADLAANLAEAPTELHQVIVTFNGNGAPTAAQINALTELGIGTGISMQSMPIVGVMATKAQVEALYQRDDVVSVWNNDELTFENYESTQITGVKAMQADQSLRNNGIPYSGRGIGVVVNDSGIDGTHGDLSFPDHVVQNVLAQTNLASFSGILPVTYQEDVINTDILGGHGTHVAGTVGGNGAMSSGLHAGVAPGADIVGYGSGAGLFILDTIGGFDYALTHQFTYNIRVISNSFGSTGDVGTEFNPDDPTNIATKMLADRGVITVFSAGNSGSGESTITGNFKKAPWVITVAAGDKNGELADFSSRGVSGKGGEVVVDGEVYTWEDRPTVTAPGVDVISARDSLSSLGALSATDDAEMIEPQHLPYYTVSSGTSMAAPHVSGIVALMLEADPTLTWREVKHIVQETATPMAAREAWEVGAGYINAHAAVRAVVDGVDVFGDTVKKDREFNGFANVTEGDAFTLEATYLPVGESPTETFEVGGDVSLVVASASIENAVAFVLEDPDGNRYGSGIGLPVLGSSVGTSAPGMAGTWKLYARGIGSISGVSVDPLGVTNGVGIPGTVEVNIRLLETSGFSGIDDAVGHPAQSFIENVVSKQLMDARSDGFAPDAHLTREELADTLTLSANLRQAQNGNVSQFTDTSSSHFNAAINSATTKGGVLSDLEMTDAAVMTDAGSGSFNPQGTVSKEDLAYSLVQALGLEAEAAAFDPADTVTAIVFGEAIELEDSHLIAPELRGHVQQALAAGLMTVEVYTTQGPFDFEPTLHARFNPANEVTRGEAAFSVTNFNNL